MFLSLLKDCIEVNGSVSVWTYLETLDGVVVTQNFHSVVYFNDIIGEHIVFETVND